jgi:hypothetical protein
MSPADEPADSASEQELAPFKIEGARSSRSQCKACRRKIEQGTLRLGVLIQGPFGAGYLWFHLKCAAKRRVEDVEQAYEQRAWTDGLEVPSIESLRQLASESEEAKQEKREAPYLERAPSGRSKCKQCSEPIEQGALRAVVLRAVQFGNQVRNGPITVHLACVKDALAAEDSATEAAGFADAVLANTRDVEPAELDAALREIGPLE